MKILMYLFCCVGGMTLIKLGAKSSNCIVIPIINFRISYTVIIGLCFYVLSFLLWLSILSNNKMSFIFPIVNGLVTVLTVISGIFILKEAITKYQIIGIVLVIAGVFISNINR